MTRKEAIFELIKYRRMLEKDSTIDAEPFDMAIEALEKAAPISNGNLINFGDIGSPTIKPLERKRGEWIDGLDVPKEERERHPYVYLHGEKHCSVCYEEAYYDTDYGQQLFDYCPNCGAKMERSKE